MDGKDNQYIPKFIQNTPWYKEGQKEEVKDHSYSKAGLGFQSDTYDAKRDRWEGYEIDYSKPQASQTEVEDSEQDTDYEMELQELGLERKDIKDNTKQDKHEKMMRSRDDVPNYIKGINSVVNDNQWDKAK